MLAVTRRITLPQNVRYFTKEGSLLARTDEGLATGSVVPIGDPVDVVYDHRDQIAVPFLMEGEIYYMLVTEIGLPELID